MFRITQDPSLGSTDSYLIKTTRNGSTVLAVCAVGVWRHIQDLWCVRVSPTVHKYQIHLLCTFSTTVACPDHAHACVGVQHTVRPVTKSGKCV
jgi:hypothetical protein